MSIVHHIASGRAELAVEVASAGAPIVLLHAGVCDRRMYRAQLGGLSAHGKIIAYDRRGFGETRAEKEDYSSVEDLKAVMDAATDGMPALLVGCSQGGGVALDMALRYPSYVRALILVAPNVRGAPDPRYAPAVEALVARRELAQKAGDREGVNALQARILLDGPLQSEGRVTGTIRDLFLDMNGVALRCAPVGTNLDDEDAFHRLGEIGVPALVLWGEYDFPHIQERSRHLAAVMPNAAGHMLAGTAHLPSMERPEETTRLFAQFIQDLR